MSFSRLLLQTLLFHWRGNLAVLLGALVGSTVLTGALLVGDSLQGSLRERSSRQLGWVEQALVAPRFFREEVAAQLRNQTGARVSGAILLRTTAAVPGDGPTRRQARNVTVLGIDDHFLSRDGGKLGSKFFGVNAELARELNLAPGNPLELRLVKPSSLPREAVLSRKDLGVTDWRIDVSQILAGDEMGSEFNLRPGVETPRNVVVPLAVLQEQLGVKGQVNALFASGGDTALESALQAHLGLEDYGLRLFTPALRAKALLDRYDRNRDGVLRGAEWFRRVDGKRKPRFAAILARGMKQANPDELTLAEITEYYQREHPYLALESDSLVLPPAVERAAITSAVLAELMPAPTLVYLCRMVANGKVNAGVVAALEPQFPPPIGPFLAKGEKRPEFSAITLVEEAWPKDNRPAVGDSVTLVYKPPESHGPAPDRKRVLRVAGYLPMAGAAADPALTPEFPGITDKDDAGDWALPFDDPSWQQQTLRKEYGDAYWDDYRATPKAFVSPREGSRLWASRFGSSTSVRLAILGVPAPSAQQLEEAAKRYRHELLAKLAPRESGFVLEDVREAAREASQGGTPFGLYFLLFSFFLILSALLLVGLLFRLNLDRRAQQVGLLFAEGYSRRTVQGLLLGEGALLALVGVTLGCLSALLYSRLLVDLLAALWPGGVLRSFLAPHWTPTSLAAGAGGAFVVCLLTIAWVVRSLAKVPPRALLAGQTTGEGELGSRPPSAWPGRIAIACALLGVVLLIVGPYVPGFEAQAGTFFGSGALFLTAGLIAVYAWMRRERHANVEGAGWWTVARLGVRNAARHPARSLLTVGLLASAAFLLVAVESFRRQAKAGDGTTHAPDGGFALVGESDLPIIRDLNSPQGRQEVLDRLARSLASRVGAAEADKHAEQAEALLKETKVVALRARAGDDASCLNLFKPRSPRLLGVPRDLIERGGFVFDATKADDAQEKSNPWQILRRHVYPFPAFGEANTVKYMLRKALGETLDVADENGLQMELSIAGLLHDSVFQSSLLVSEDQFLRLYPGTEGYTFFLIQSPPGREDEVKDLLETALSDRGFAVTRSADRLAAFLAVENTYLTTFQALGGLGLLLGSLGLAVVLLRAVWERRGELALLRATGWPRRTLGWLVLAENGFLLVLGLLLGATAALLSITPQLLRGAGAVPWANLVLLFALVLVAGLVAGALAIFGTLRAPIVPALRRE